MLYKDAEWWEDSWDNEKEWLNQIVKNSFVFIALYLEKEIIGMGRAISDGISDAYIQDIIVKENFKRKGFGKIILKEIIKRLKNNKIDWIGLIAKPNTKSFYEKCDFKEMDNFTPMKL